MRKGWIAAALLLATARAAAGQEPPHAHGEHVHGLGTVDFPNSGAPAAQEPFLRGVALLHSFEYEDAADAFRSAQQADPAFALAFWMEALTSARLLWGREYSAAAREALARLGPTPEARLARAGTPRERAYGAAVEALFGEGGLGARARAYADSLRGLAAREAGDLEAAAFASIAVQMATAVGGYGTTGAGALRAAREEAITLADRVFRANRDHPGAAHYLIHAYDDPAVAPRGLEMARAYAQIAPDAQHALHMPSHIFVQVGLWDDVVASNERAWAASRAWVQRRGASGTELDFHSLEWLQHGYLQQGRLGAARALVDTARAVLAGADVSSTVDPGFVEQRLTFRYAAETGRWHEPLAGARTPRPPPGAESRFGYFRLVSLYQAAAGAALRGDTASPAIGALREALPAVAAGEGGYAALIPLQVEGLLARARGDLAAAIEALTRAAAADESIAPTGPPAALPTLELLGSVLLEAGRPAEAADAFERALTRWPNRSASLLGLARARRAAGDGAAAAEAYRRLLANWQQADEDHPALAEVRSGAR